MKEELGILGEAFFELSAGAIYQYCVDNTIGFPFDKLFPGMEQGLQRQNPIDRLSNQYPGFRVGRMIGDVAALYKALGEITIGSGMDGGGLVAAPETGGASLVLTVPGNTLIIHGTYTSVSALADLAKQLRIVFRIEGNNENHNQSEHKPMLGAKGTQVSSKTVWKGQGKERIDVENPNPGQRPGQIHYQDNDGNTYIYDTDSKTFRDFYQPDKSVPRKVSALLEDPSFNSGIQKALKYLGE